MKIRIKGNVVRIRLTRSEVKRFAGEGYIEASTAFISNVFTYALQSQPDEYGHELSADFKDCVLTMYVPEKMAKQWVSTDIVGFDTLMEIENGERLYLILEKDLQALDETMQDETGNYENPLAYKHN